MTGVARHGLAVEGYDEPPVAAHLKGSEIEIGVDIGLGDGRATLWTCDLTPGYIRINADSRSSNEGGPRREARNHDESGTRQSVPVDLGGCRIFTNII